MDSESSEEYDPVETSDEAAEILKEIILDFANALLSICQQEESDHPEDYENSNEPTPTTRIIYVTSLLRAMETHDLPRHYTNYVLNWKPMIEAKNESFFLDNDNLYPNAPQSYIDFFKSMWLEDSIFHLSEDEKGDCFEQFDAMLHYCEEWKRLSGYTARWELFEIVKEEGEDQGYKTIMNTYNVDSFEDFGFGCYDQFCSQI